MASGYTYRQKSLPNTGLETANLSSKLITIEHFVVPNDFGSFQPIFFSSGAQNELESGGRE